jgi:hypothetical protein
MAWEGAMRSVFGILVSLALIGVASDASAATVTFSNGFEGIGPYMYTGPVVGCPNPCDSYAYNTDYSEGGITVRDVITGGTNSDAAVILNLTKDWGGIGNFNWYTAANGYTDIRLTNGAQIQTLQFLGGSGRAFPDANNRVAYQLLLHGLVVGTGSLLDNTFCCGNLGGGFYQAVTFSGGGFDEVRVQGDTGLDSFNPNAFDVQALDNITATSVTPIPGALPLFATGLGVIGLLGWRRRRKAQVALAVA